MPYLHDHKGPQVWWRPAEKKTFKTGFRHSIFTKDGDRYRGEWLQNKKSGKGFLHTRTNRLYEGDWERDYRHGFGWLSHMVEDGTFELDYSGDWCNGKYCGTGTKYFADGGVYIGGFKNNLRHGYGRMWFSNKTYYEGEWKKDYFEGNGIFVQVNGNRYEGEFHNGLRHGRGRFYHLDNGVLQEGLWHYGTCVCSTIIVIPYRQSAIEPTQYPIQPNKLLCMDDVIMEREFQVRNNHLSCASITQCTKLDTEYIHILNDFQGWN